MEATVVDHAKEGLEKDFAKTNPGIVAAFTGVAMDTNARDFVDKSGELQVNPNRQQDSGNRLSIITATEAIATVNHEVLQATNSSIATRIDTLSSFSAPSPASDIRVSSEDSLGVAAGDDELSARYGIWTTPFYSQSRQKQRSNSPGYKSKSGGGTVGFDCLVNDNLALGAAFTGIHTKLDHKNKKIGDTTKIESTLFSMYGIQQLSNNYFIQGIASFGSSRVRNYEKRIIDLTTDQTALGKYNSTTYSMEMLGGYRYLIPNTNSVLTPMAGLRYAKFNDAGYVETGTNKRNFIVSKKSMDKVTGIIGARASFSSQINNVLLMPEIHGFINHDFKNKNPKVEARLDGAKALMPSATSKSQKAFFNVGTSLTVKYNMMEYGVAYDANLAKKYIGHQGSLKVRVNF